MNSTVLGQSDDARDGLRSHLKPDGRALESNPWGRANAPASFENDLKHRTGAEIDQCPNEAHQSRALRVLLSNVFESAEILRLSPCPPRDPPKQGPQKAP